MFHLWLETLLSVVVDNYYYTRSTLYDEFDLKSIVDYWFFLAVVAS
jgi:hypothetical protein